MSRGRAARAAQVVGLLLVLSSVPAAPSRAAESDELVGYEAFATGMAFTLSPSIPALLPMEVPAEATTALATATLSSGGQGFGRASTFFPGTPIAGIRPLLETAAGIRLPIPDYPLVVESREFEPAKHNEQPGITMSSDVDPDRAVAIADAAGMSLPGIVSVRTSRTVSTSRLEAGVVTATSTTRVEGIDLLGSLQIESIVSTATVTSDAVEATCEGSVVVNGVTVDGQPATIDADGVHAQGSTLVPTDVLGDLLSPAPANGVTVRLLGGADRCEGANGSRSSAGLLVSIPLPAVAAIPPGGHVDLILGSVTARAGASTLPAFEPPTTPPLPVPSGSGGLVLPDLGSGGAPTISPPAPSAPPAAEPAVTTPPLLTSTPAAYAFAGVPAPLLAGLLLLALPAGRRVRRYMERVLRVLDPA